MNGALPLSAVLTPAQLRQISAQDSIMLIGQSGVGLDSNTARYLGANVPRNASFSAVVSASCCVPFEVILRANASQLLASLGQMNLPLVSNKRLARISSLVRIYPYNF